MQSLNKILSLAARFETKLRKNADDAAAIQQQMKSQLGTLQTALEKAKGDDMASASINYAIQQINLTPVVPNHLRQVASVLSPYAAQYGLQAVVDLANSVSV